MSSVNGRYNVGGIYLQRPFKIRRLGHFGFNVEKLPEGREFYGDLLGFTTSDTLDFSKAPWFPKDADLGDPRGYFMRYERVVIGAVAHEVAARIAEVGVLREPRRFREVERVGEIEAEEARVELDALGELVHVEPKVAEPAD